MGRGVGNGLAGKFEAAAVGEDEGEGEWGDGGRGGGEVDFEEGRGRAAAIGVEGGDGEIVGGTEGGAGEAAGLVVGEEGLDLSGCAAGTGLSAGHPYTKTESEGFGKDGGGRSLTLQKHPEFCPHP